MSMLVTISKGSQLTIPAEYRKELNISAGSRVELEMKGKNLMIIPLSDDLKKLFEEAKNVKVKHDMTAKEMDEYIKNEVLGH